MTDCPICSEKLNNGVCRQCGYAEAADFVEYRSLCVPTDADVSLRANCVEKAENPEHLLNMAKQHLQSAIEYCEKAVRMGAADAAVWLKALEKAGEDAAKTVPQNKAEVKPDDSDDPKMRMAQRFIGKGQYNSAISALYAVATEGSAEAQYTIGMCYKNRGNGVSDRQNAIKWLEKAAQQGHREAQKCLKTMTANTDKAAKTVKQDKTKAEKKSPNEEKMEMAKRLMSKGQYQSAISVLYGIADAGSAEAQILIGKCYVSRGNGSIDHQNAIKWFERAAQQGNSEAQRSLESLRRSTRGIFGRRYK